MRRPVLARPEWIVETRRQRLDDLHARLHRARDVCLFRWQQRLALAAGKLQGLSPLATLARGYALVSRLPEQEPVTSAAQLSAGDEVRVRLRDGALTARVSDVEVAETPAETPEGME